ncbi:MAG TPA: hypothetical protein VF175_09180, partial [Lacipirellula sp.]
GGTGGIPGDIDADGDVDGRDFLAIQRGLGSTTDQSDIQDFRDNFGTGVPPVVPAAASAVAAVPEPGALLLAAALFSPAILAGRRLRHTN